MNVCNKDARVHHVCDLLLRPCMVLPALTHSVEYICTSDHAFLFVNGERRAAGRGTTRSVSSLIPVRRIGQRAHLVKFEPRVEPNTRIVLLPKVTSTRKNTYHGSLSRSASPAFFRRFLPEVSGAEAGTGFGTFDFSDSNSFK